MGTSSGHRKLRMVYSAFAGALLVAAVAAGYVVVSGATPNLGTPEDSRAEPSSRLPSATLTPPPLAPTGPGAQAAGPIVVLLGNTGNVYSRTLLLVPRESTVTVTFTNSDSEPHDFGVSIPAVPHTETCRGPCSRSLTFNTGAPGNYSFQCTLHQGMVGVLTVY
jgi:Cupredoxin-like domain